MDKLWAPWRMQYVLNLKDKRPLKCVFCRILKEKQDRKNFIFLRRKLTFSVLNIYPYNNGHVLVVPNRHVDDLTKLTPAEREELFDLLSSTKMLVDKALKPHGYNIGINLGRVAGAGFPGHLHIHVVPRWRGDVNFMPITADTKVISQSLKVLYKRLSDAQTKRN